MDAKKPELYAVVISDLHLERKDCKTELLLRILQSFPYNSREILIINGDLYENGSPICDEGLRVIDYFRANRESEIYIAGNHDQAGKSIVNSLLGIEIFKRYRLEIAGKTFHIEHGDRFDGLLFSYGEPLLDAVILKLLSLAKRMDPGKWHIAKWLDDFHAKHAYHVAQKAMRYAKRHRIDIMIIGHTHRQEDREFFGKNRRPVKYFNSGSWINETCALVCIYKNGDAELHTFSAK